MEKSKNSFQFQLSKCYIFAPGTILLLFKINLEINKHKELTFNMFAPRVVQRKTVKEGK